MPSIVKKEVKMKRVVKYIISVVALVLMIVFGILLYLNIIAPIKVECIKVECEKQESTYGNIERMLEAYKNDTIDKYTIVYNLEEDRLSNNPDDYRYVSLRFNWKNRSILEKQTVNCYITEIEPGDIALYSQETRGIYFITEPAVEKGEENEFATGLYIYIANHTDEEIIDMLKSITIHCVMEGKHTGIKEKDIKLSEVYDLSKVIIER